MYRPKSLLRSIKSGSNVIFTSASDFSNGPTAKNFKIEKVLVLSKLSHYSFERYRNKDLTEHELEHKIRNRGTDYDKLVHYHKLHESFERRVVNVLREMGANVRLVNRLQYTEDAIHWADVVMPTGGDGTFLLAASRIRDNQKPVIGFNSDPNRSEGHLCLPKKYSADIREAIEKLKNGYYKWLFRSRIRTTLIGQRGTEACPKHLHECDESIGFQFCKENMHPSNRVLPYLALNEVFIGEALSARVSHIGMWLNGTELETNVKCSGVCICTGTGSTSWNLSINRLPVQSVAELLRLIPNIEGQDDLAATLAKNYNNNLIFSPDDNRMCYTIRDLISAGVWPQPKGIKSRGFVTKIKIKSNCFDAGLVIDGGVSFDFNDGTIAILEIHPRDALRTVVLTE